MNRYLVRTLVIISFAITCGVPASYAELQRVGPNNPAPSVGNFPAWYQDNTGLTLEFCDPKNQAEVDGGWCLLLPGDVTVPEVFPTNFFDEHFWFAADAGMTHAGTPGGGNRVLLVLAVEAAFAADVVPGGQITFSRIRVRMDDVPVDGVYRFIHPYGEELIEGVAGERIFFTDDTGITCPPGQFDCALQSRLGPFLLPSDSPGGAELPAVAGPVPGKLYIADPARSGPVTGSPTGNNRFRVEGPPGSNLGGPGIDAIETSDFTLMGRIFTDTLPGQVTVNRAGYTRNSTVLKVDVFANAFETAPGRLPTEPVPAPVLPQLSFFDAPCTPSGLDNNLDPIPPFSAPINAAEIQMVNAGNNFWGQAQLGAIPAEVCVKDNVTLTYFPKSVVDEVVITEALYTPGSQNLSVKARSGDSTVPPTLTLGGFGDLEGGSIIVTPLEAPPATVRVLSSHGGVDEFQVTTSTIPPLPATGATLSAFPASPQPPGTQVAFVATGSGGTGTYEYRFTLTDGITTNVVQPYSSASAWVWNTATQPFGAYQVAADVRSLGSTADTEVTALASYALAPLPATEVTLTANPPSPSGDNVVFTAAAGGGSGNYQYRFWLLTNGVWSIVQDYSTDSTWTWDTAGVTAGDYLVAVHSRSVGSTTASEAGATLNYLFTGNPVTGVTLNPDLSSPRPAGDNVVFTAVASGGSGNYQYRFWLLTNGVWSIVQDYSNDSTWTWDTAGVTAGDYLVAVHSRSVGSAVPSEAGATYMFTLQ